MSVQLSPARESVPILPGLKLLNRGKVRDTYEIGDHHLLIVTTDGISIFDFVLNALVPQKGMILNALTHFWTNILEGTKISTHVVAAGKNIDFFLPPELREMPDLQSRAMVVHRLDMKLVEFIVRGYLTGSGLKSYEKDGTVCGHTLPLGLQDGDSLPEPIFTPTTKSTEGHDLPLTAEDIACQYPWQSTIALQAYQVLHDRAKSNGVIIADTKFEFGAHSLGDEYGTPDSSRFWDLREWEQSRNAKEKRKAPSPYDKQYVRAWGIDRGINGRDPENPEDVAWVHQQSVPEPLINRTRQIYRYIFWRLTGKTIEAYLRDEIGVAIEVPKRKVAVILGSQTDIPELGKALQAKPQIRGVFPVHVISCHRNPTELSKFCWNGCDGAEVVVAAGGKALALPGVAAAHLAEAGNDIPVIGVALGDPGSESFEAAKLSISQLPDQLVVIDEQTGQPYAGSEGLAKAIWRATFGECPPPKIRKSKPARFNIELPP